jgi:uncharacterized protein (TIGR03067 family)
LGCARGRWQCRTSNRPIITNRIETATRRIVPVIDGSRRCPRNGTNWSDLGTEAQEETMLRTTALLLTVGVFGAAPAPENTAKLEGAWVATSFVDHGQKVDKDTVSKIILTLKDGKYTLKVAGTTVDEGTYAIDASKSPGHFDTTATSGDKKGVVDRGIYELKGNTLKTSFEEVTKQQRPASFDAQKYQVVEFTRGK